LISLVTWTVYTSYHMSETPITAELVTHQLLN